MSDTTEASTDQTVHRGAHPAGHAGAHTAALPAAPPPGTPEWEEWVKDYYRNVETYDWVVVTDQLQGPEAFFHRNRERVVRGLVRKYARPDLPILDAGCGTGLNLRHLPAGSVGLDINPRNVETVTRRLPHQQCVLGDVEAMPFADASFGTVVCTEVLEHVPDPRRALAEIRRVLMPGGVLIGSVPARSWVWRLRFLSSTCPGDEPFHNEYTPPEVRALLADFHVDRVWYSLLRFNVLFVART
jgi:SAM-dependent methyltransferase